ncbi:MAG: class I SAM-dependent methyltransferase [Myxococcales bacterium]|nr:class I SAM-dependent methyltransferase [Myxococcales bacterium]
MTELLADPLEGGALRRDGALLRNDAGVWPVLGGVPILVPDPARWLRGAREHVLAALGEVGRLGADDVALLDAFCAAVRGVDAAAIDDDFLADEEGPIDVVVGPSAPLVTALLGRRAEVVERLVSQVGPGPVLEIGCGAGTATRRIGARPLVVVDRSLRALLRATAGTDAQPVVGLAEALPVASEAFGTVVAAHVIDLLDDPGAFVTEVARILRSGGRFVLSTPDPALGAAGGTDEAVVDLLEDEGLTVVEDLDGLPWVRSHGPRHHQLYVVRLVVARR